MLTEQQLHELARLIIDKVGRPVVHELAAMHRRGELLPLLDRVLDRVLATHAAAAAVGSIVRTQVTPALGEAGRVLRREVNRRRLETIVAGRTHDARRVTRRIVTGPGLPTGPSTG